jgi:hypothetical protein
MSLVLSGSLVIASSGTQQPQVDTFGDLKSCVAKTLNSENQPKILSLAGDGINRAILWTNLNHKFRFGSKQSSDTALVDGTQAVSLASDFWAIQEVQLIDTDSKVAATLEYLPWGQFNVLEQTQTATGQPVYWTSRNTFDDNQILLYPVPDATAAADYTVRVTYYERIQRPTSDSDIIDAPQELGLVLCTYAEGYVLFVRDRTNVAAWASKKREAKELLTTFMHSTEEEPTAGLQWRLHWVDEPVTRYDPLG